jgi:hypothetical protein
VAEYLNLCRIEESARLLVLRKGVVRPGIPETLHHLGELVGTLVARVARDMLTVAEVQRIARIGRGHEIPARAAAADVIKRGEAPRDVERFVVGCGGGGDQPDVPRHHRQRRQQRDRFKHPRSVGGRGGGEKVRLVHLADAVAISEKEKVHLAGLCDLRKPHGIGDIRGRIVPRLGMAPLSHMAALGVGVGGEDHRHGW